MRGRLLLLAGALLAGMLTVAAARAQEGGGEGPTDDEVNRVAKKLYCPVCPNTPLDVCETKACQDWRAQIRDQLAAGWTEEQVLAYFVEQYGERVLAEPQRKGFTSLVWILPLIAITLGLTGLGRVVRDWRRARRRDGSPEGEMKSPPALPPDVADRIERDLKEIS
ncbi:MAG: cytochrome c-type biogenesis protein [Anaerolineales bacterium]